MTAQAAILTGYSDQGSGADDIEDRSRRLKHDKPLAR
jgi:hypothetical protein